MRLRPEAAGAGVDQCGGERGRAGGVGADRGPARGALPGVTIADRVLEGVTCLRLDALVVTCYWDKEGAGPDFKGFGLRPLGCWCDNTAEPLAAKLRPGSAGKHTVADHLEVPAAAIGALPPRRRLMVTCDGAGASHGLIEHLDKLTAPAWPPARLLRRLDLRGTRAHRHRRRL